MRLKRVQLKLEGAWQSLHSLSTHKGAAAAGADRVAGADTHGSSSRADEEAATETAAKLRALQHVRHHMAHLVTNLQIYIQVRCGGEGETLSLAGDQPADLHPGAVGGGELSLTLRV